MPFLDFPVQLGETSIEFYESLTQIFIKSPPPISTPIPTSAAGLNVTTTVTAPSPSVSEVTAEGGQWACSECTFYNHPALDQCEQCEMPRITQGRLNNTFLWKIIQIYEFKMLKVQSPIVVIVIRKNYRRKWDKTCA